MGILLKDQPTVSAASNSRKGNRQRDLRCDFANVRNILSQPALVINIVVQWRRDRARLWIAAAVSSPFLLPLECPIDLMFSFCSHEAKVLVKIRV